MNILFLLLLTWNVQEADTNLMESYLHSYVDIAKAEMVRTGIPASIKLAQGMLESNYGRSDLANKANNHFGIKCGNHWEGKGFYREDDDYTKQGDLMKSCFRVFESAEQSYVAHSNFLTDPKKEYRYGKLFDLGRSDYQSWAHGLKNAGYATDKKYPAKLIFIIEKYDLAKYDNEVLDAMGEPVKIDGAIAQGDQTKSSSDNRKSDGEVVWAAPPKSKRIKDPNSNTERKSPDYSNRKRVDIKINNQTRFVMPWENETTEELAKRVGIAVDNIIVYNDHLSFPAEELTPNIPVYLEHKNRDFKGPVEVHLVKEGETIDLIAQRYGVRVNTLRVLNRIPNNGTPLAGERVWLKKKIKSSRRPKCKRMKRKQYLF